MNDDRAQYKKTLGNFLSRDNKKKNDDYSDETDSNDEDGDYVKKHKDKIARADEKTDTKKLKIFDDDDCEGEGSDDDDDSGDDESYEDEVADDSDDDDLISSGDDNGSSGQKKKQSAEKAAKDIIEKASFQTALDVPAEEVNVKIAKPKEQVSPKAVEVIQVSAEQEKPKAASAGAAEDKQDAKLEAPVVAAKEEVPEPPKQDTSN